MKKSKNIMRILRSRTFVQVGTLGAALMLAAPPAYAGWESILSAITPVMGNIFSALTNSRYPGAFLAGLGLQEKARAKIQDVKSMNGARNVNAKLAGKIAIDHHVSSSYNACGISKSAGTFTGLQQSTAGLGSAIGMGHMLNAGTAKDDYEKYQKAVAEACGNQDGPTYKANKAGFNCGGNQYGNMNSTPSVMTRASVKAPDSIVNSGTAKNVHPEKQSQEFKEFQMAASYVAWLAPSYPPEPGGSSAENDANRTRLAAQAKDGASPDNDGLSLGERDEGTKSPQDAYQLDERKAKRVAWLAPSHAQQSIGMSVAFGPAQFMGERGHGLSSAPAYTLASTVTPGMVDYYDNRTRTAAFAGAASAVAARILANMVQGGELKSQQVKYQEEMQKAKKLSKVDSNGMSAFKALEAEACYMTDPTYVQERLSNLPPEFGLTADAKCNANMIKVQKVRSLAYTALNTALKVKATYEAKNGNFAPDRVRITQNVAPQPAPNAVSDTGHFKVSSTKQEPLE